MASDSYLLDTHCLIWFQENNPQIPRDIMNLIQDENNAILFSQISLFEISIKQKIGKLPAFNVSIEEVYKQAIDDGFTFLNIQNRHIYNYDLVPLVGDHRDPFDRLFIATAMSENATILSADSKLKQYFELVNVMW